MYLHSHTLTHTHTGFAKSKAEIDELFALIDSNGDGVISFEEYLEAMSEKYPKKKKK